MRTGILMATAIAAAALVGLVVQQRPKSSPYAAVAATATRPEANGGPSDAEQPATDNPSESLKGRVREVIDVAQYTYLRLGTPQGEVWAAVSKAPVKVDSDVSVENPTRMDNFESATLKRTFEVIYFGSLPANGAARPHGDLPPGHPSIDGTPTLPAAHGNLSPQAPTSDAPDLKVSRASGSNAHSIGELFTEGAKLEGKLLRVRGKVVKVTPGVQGLTYLRLRDGSSARPEERELVVTSRADVQVGALMTFEGTLRTQVDVGIGFRYPILLAEAKVLAEPTAKTPSPGR
jgi:hypothetical protein